MLKNVVWLDLETSGLDARNCEILELAFAYAPEDPTVITVRDSMVFPCMSDPRDWHPEVVAMHSANGLLAACVKAYKASSLQTASRLQTAVKRHFFREKAARRVRRRLPQLPGNEKFILAGNSVHFDLGFLREHIPELAELFSHRLLDVSAAKLFCRSLGYEPPKRVPVHRAAYDVEASIAEFKQLQEFARGLGTTLARMPALG